MILESCKKLALITSGLLLLMQFCLARHFHSPNSYHDAKDSFHIQCTHCIPCSSNSLALAIHGFIFPSPLIEESELLQGDYRGGCRDVFVSFTRCRAPPCV